MRDCVAGTQKMHVRRTVTYADVRVILVYGLQRGELCEREGIVALVVNVYS